MSTADVHVVEMTESVVLRRPGWPPPLWLFPYLGSIIAANLAGSGIDSVAGANIEHVFLGGSLGMAAMFLLFEGNWRHIDGLPQLSKYMALLGIAVFLGLLSSIHPGPRLVGDTKLVYWCGLVLSTSLAALAAMRNHSRLVLAAIVLGGIPLSASVLLPFFPFLATIVPAARIHDLFMGRATGLFMNPNTTGFVLYCGFAGCLCLYPIIRSWLIRLMLLAMCLVYAASVSLTLSRGSMLVMAITAFAFLRMVGRKTSHRQLVTLVMVALAVYIGQHFLSSHMAAELAQTRLLEKDLYEGDTFRLQGLVAAGHNFCDLLFLGEGTDQFVEVSGAYIDRCYKAPHNQVLGIWVEWGLLALILMYAAHVWVITRSLSRGLWRIDNCDFMLLSTFISILLYLQLHEVYNPASCALIGLFLGRTFKGREFPIDCPALGATG